MTLLLVGVCLVVAVFAITNGLHDTAVAVAGVVSTRTLTPGVALVMVSFFTVLGSLTGAAVVRTFSTSVVRPEHTPAGLAVLIAGVAGAALWNLITWRRGLPSSSSWALVGGLLGAGMVSRSTVHWSLLVSNVLLPLVAFLLVAFVVSYLSMLTVIWAAHRQPPSATNHRFRMGQSVAAAAVALGHGIQDGQKSLGVVVLALDIAGRQAASIPTWARLLVALSLGLGTFAGGWRILSTVGRRIVSLDPGKGFVSGLSSAGTLVVAAGWLGAPVSSTYTVTASLVGVGAVRGWRRVRWRVVGRILLTALATLPASAAVGALLGALLRVG